MDIPDKKILREKEKFPAVLTAQRVPFKLLLFSFWPHDTTMLLNSPPWTHGDNAVILENFHEKRKLGRAVRIRLVIVRFH